MSDWSLRPGFPEGRIQSVKTHPQVASHSSDGIDGALSAPEEQVADVAPGVVGVGRDHAEGGDLLPRSEHFTQDSQSSDVGRGAALCTVLHMVHQPSQDVTKCQLDQWEMGMIQDDLNDRAEQLAKEQRLRWQLVDQKRREESSAKIITWLVYIGAVTALGAWFWGVVR